MATIPLKSKGPLNVPKRYFWEFNYDRIDWDKEGVAIIQRVLERGTPGDYEELVKYYGRRKILHSLKKKINYLRADVMEVVSAYFKIDITQLRCYTLKQSRQGHWI
jgi:hypothetical protein